MYLKQLSSAFALSLLAISHVNAAVIFDVEDPGTVSSTQAGINEVDFNDGTIGSYQSVTGQFAIFDSTTTTPGADHSAPPYQIVDGGNFMSVPNPYSSGTAIFEVDGSYNYFGMFWGSVDTYNTIEFFNGDNSVGSFSGGDISPPLDADGGQGDWDSNRYVNFFFNEGDTFDSFQMTSTNYAFETDNHAYGNLTNTVNNIPEPGSIALLALGLVGLGAARRRQ